ncbi:MAG: FAD-dependent oxidoreductase [Candidatus Bathyarchaeota archaeon]|nr:FAD-dependent oxidoreductase [Candidatus Bathyarchaeota archaeon]
MRNEKIIVSDEFLKQLLDIEKLKHCFECGKCTASCPMVELFPKSYNPRILLEKIFLNPEKVLYDEELWLCAWCYRCYRRCPQGLKVPEILLSLRKIAIEEGYSQGFEKALKMIKEKIPFPSTFCWVCLHPDRTKIDATQVTNFLKGVTTDYEYERKTPEVKVAIVGSGPAGLTAAHELAKKGYSITVFESFPELGGMLSKCIPKYRLPKGLLDTEIRRLKDSGIDFKTEITVGKDLTLNKLLQGGYRAVFVATGAHKSRRLQVEGEDLEGVIYALDFLREVNLGKYAGLKGNIVVVGGGNTAMDTAITACRLGPKEVHILYRRSKEEMPANPWKVKETEEKSVKFQFLVAPRRIIGKEGRVAAIECIRMELGEPDESGRRRPIPVEGSEFLVEADTLILAIGETPDLSFLPKEIDVTEKNTVAVYLFTMETTKEGIFAGGDVVSGPATVVEAIVAGKRAAESIDGYLRSKIRSDRKIKQVVDVSK